MRRRQFITALFGSTALGLAGCITGDRSANGTPPGEKRHPLADKTVTVRIDDQSDTDHDVEAIARRALEYWAEHSEAYVDFPIAFDVVADGDPDAIIRFVDRPDECHRVENYSKRVLGCAPLIKPGRTLTGPVRAIVVAAARPVGKITITTKHELGHILGLGHEDEPLETMSDRPELRIPMYELRIEIWETILAARDGASDATVLLDRAISTWSDGNYAGAEASFHAAKTAYGEALARLEAARERIEAFADDSRVETVDLEGLRRDLDRLIERTHLAEGIASAMVEASAAAEANDQTTVNERLSTANARIREFNETEAPELRDVAIALGLVRGFDRDEPVIDVEEDEIAA